MPSGATSLDWLTSRGLLVCAPTHTLHPLARRENSCPNGIIVTGKICAAWRRPVKIACPQCQALNYHTDRVCLGCGAELPWTAGSAPSPGGSSHNPPDRRASSVAERPPRQDPRWLQAGAAAGGVLVGGLCGMAPGPLAVAVAAVLGSGVGSWGVYRCGGTGLEIVSGAAVGAVAGLLFRVTVGVFAPAWAGRVLPPGWVGAVAGGASMYWWARPITWRDAEARIDPDGIDTGGGL